VKQALISIILGFMSVTALAQSPDDLVRETAELLDQKLADQKETLAADRTALYEMINEILLPRFDRRYSAQLVLGRHWRSASEEQRQRFIDTFYNAMLRQYADGLLEFDMSRLEILPYRGDESSSRTMVRTTVRLDDGTKVPVDYGLVQRDSGWMLFDVRIEGISYVRRFRTEFESEIQSTSLDAVIERLERDAKAPPAAQQQGDAE
jgi:phospholipid transport system substrate-binding protein